MSRTAKIALIVSICVNVFVLAGVVGELVVLLHRQPQVLAATGQATPPARPPLTQAALGLARPQQLAFRRALRAARQANAGAAAAAVEDRQSLLQLLAAPQFDRAAIDQALSQIRADDSAQRVAAEKAVVDFAAQLSPAERAAFVKRLSNLGTFRPAIRAAASSPTPATDSPPPAR